MVNSSLEPSTPWKRVFQLALLIGLIGAVLVSWLAPKAIAWYFDPPVNIGVNCRQAVEWSMSRLQTSQLIGFIIGILIGLAISWRILRVQGKEADTQ